MQKIMHYSVQLRDQMFVKGYGFLSFAKNMVKILEKISKNISCKYIQKLLDYGKQSAADALEAASKKKKKNSKSSIGNKIAAKITKNLTTR